MALPKKGYGLCFVIENFEEDEYRRGASKAAFRLQVALRQVGVKLIEKTDVTADQMETIITEFCEDNKKELDDYETVWLVISTHGDYAPVRTGAGDQIHDIVKGSNGWKSVCSLTKLFTSIVKKPVVIIIQACRGIDLAQDDTLNKDKDSGKVLGASSKPQIRYEKREEISNEMPDRVPVWANQILLWSSTPGNLSFRLPLFRAIEKVLKEEDLTKTAIEALFTKVVAVVAEDFKSKSSVPWLNNRKATPVYYSMLLDDIYLK